MDEAAPMAPETPVAGKDAASASAAAGSMAPRPEAAPDEESTMGQNRKKHSINSHPIIYCPTIEGVSKVSEQANERVQRSTRGKRVVRNKQMSERCERTSKRTSEWSSTSVCILGCSGPQLRDEGSNEIVQTTTMLTYPFPRLRPRRPHDPRSARGEIEWIESFRNTAVEKRKMNALLHY